MRQVSLSQPDRFWAWILPDNSALNPTGIYKKRLVGGTTSTRNCSCIYVCTHQKESSNKLDSQRFARGFGWHFESMIKGGMNYAIRLLLVQTRLVQYRPNRWKQRQIRWSRKHGTDLCRVSFATKSLDDILSNSINLNWNLLGWSVFPLPFLFSCRAKKGASRSIQKHRWYLTEYKVKFLICPIKLYQPMSDFLLIIK